MNNLILRFHSTPRRLVRRIDRIDFQQQSQLTSIDVGFGDAEKFAKGMMFRMSAPRINDGRSNEAHGRSNEAHGGG